MAHASQLRSWKVESRYVVRLRMRIMFSSKGVVRALWPSFCARTYIPRCPQRKLHSYHFERGISLQTPKKSSLLDREFWRGNILQSIHRSCVSYPSRSCVSIDRKISIPSTQNGPVQDTEAGLHDEGATRLQARHQKSKRSKTLSLYVCIWR